LINSFAIILLIEDAVEHFLGLCCSLCDGALELREICFGLRKEFVANLDKHSLSACFDLLNELLPLLLDARERDVAPLERARLEITHNVLVDFLHFIGPVSLQGSKLLGIKVKVHWVHHVFHG